MFYEFLNNHRCTEGPTHLAYGNFNGKFNIPSDKYNEFIKLYNNELKNEKELNILECQTDYSKILIDIDIKINKEDYKNKRLYNIDLIKKVGKLYIKSIKNNLNVNNEDLTCYLLEKSEPTINNKDVKDGFHLVFPDIITNKIMREKIYNDVLLMDDSLKSMLDKAVINNGWFMYGSSKPNKQPYELTEVFNNKMYEITEKFSFTRSGIIKKLSLYDCKKEHAKEIKITLDDIKENKSTKENNNNNNNNNNNKNTDDETIKIILENLCPSRFDNYNDWISIYMIFKNCNLNLDLFDEFSRKSDKYNKNTNFNILKNIQNRDGLTISTLYYWLKQDNLEVFKNLMSKNNDFFDNKIINNKDLAELYFNMNPRQYIYNNNFGWYVYNKYNVLESFKKEAPPSLLNDISNKLQEWLNTLKDSISLNDEKAQDKFKEIKKAYKLVGSSNFGKGVIDYLKNMYYVKDLQNKIDNNKNVISFNNMLYDLEKGKFRNIEPEDFISKTTGYEIKLEKNENIRNKINNLLYSIFENEDVIKFWETSTALSIFGKSFESLYIHTGRGRNGKGVLSTILKAALGDYFITADNTFLTTPFKSGSANPILASSKGARFLLVTEPDNGTQECKLNLDFVKSMTGSDEITARKLYEDNITFKPFFSLTLQCNQKPKLNKVDKAIEERLKIINYPFTFVDFPFRPDQRKKNNNLKDEITKPDYINEFIIYLCEIANKYKNIDFIELPKEVKEENKLYIDENNDIMEFINEYYEITNNEKDRVKSSELLSRYNGFADNKIRSDQLKDKMNYNNFVLKKYKDGNYYIGLKEKLETNDTEGLDEGIN